MRESNLEQQTNITFCVKTDVRAGETLDLLKMANGECYDEEMGCFLVPQTVQVCHQIFQ